MANLNLTTDSPLSRRIVRAFLNFLNSGPLSLYICSLFNYSFFFATTCQMEFAFSFLFVFAFVLIFSDLVPVCAEWSF